MLMTNGLGATLGTFAAGMVVDATVGKGAPWSTTWYIFAAYALVVGIAFMFLFKNPNIKVTEVKH